MGLHTENSTMARTGAAIDSGLNYLHQNQLATGEFSSYISSDVTMKSGCKLDSAIFPTALILYSLHFVKSPLVEEMNQSGVQFLKGQMLKEGAWKYWSTANENYKNIPCDIDDTVCASWIFKQSNVEFPDNKKLILSNCDSRGLLYTWIVPRFKLSSSLSYNSLIFKQALNFARLIQFWKLTESQPDDIDSVVNANALLYLGFNSSTAPIAKYLVDLIDRDSEDSFDKWHLSPMNLFYSISKIHHNQVYDFDSVKDKIVERILSKKDDDGTIGGNVLETALALCTLFNFKEFDESMVDASVELILSKQNKLGAWPRLPHYYGGPKRLTAWGSCELTSAYCLETLARFQELRKQ